MKASGPIDLALGLLDHQLVDCDGRRCGKIDDVELSSLTDGTPHVTAFVVGAAAWSSRGRLGRVAARLARARRVKRIPWTEIEEIGSAVHLKKRATDLGLGTGDERARRWVARLPHAQ